MMIRLFSYLASLLWIGIFILPLTLKSQETISSSQSLMQVLNDRSLNLYERKANYLGGTDHSIPIIEEAVFRTETDEFRLGRQEYTARIKFNSKAERRAQEKFHQTNILASNLDKNLVVQNNLVEKYELWMNYFFCENEKKIRQAEQAVLEDKLKVITILAKVNAEYDLADLLQVEDDLDDLENDIFELQSRMDYSRNLIANDLGLPIKSSLNISNFITLETLENTLTILPNHGNIHPVLMPIKGDMLVDAAEIELEKAKQKKMLDFVQLKYAGRDEKTPFAREWSLGVGIKIPIKNSDILDIRSLELSQLESENELELTLLEMQKRIESRNANIQILFQQHDLLNQQLAKQKENYSLEHYAKTGTDPLILLEIRERELKKERAILNIEKDIYLYYLDILELTGKISEMPFVNYLSENLDTF